MIPNHIKPLRLALIAAVFVGGFYYLTTHHSESGQTPVQAVSDFWQRNFGTPTKVEITEAADPENYDSEEQNNITVYKRNSPSVVNITSKAVVYDFFWGAQPQEGQGSGFIIDKEGHILTNNHVITGAQEVFVTLSDRRRLRAKVVGADPSHDLAVLQIKANDLNPLTLGDSSKLQVGQKVYAIGNPFGLSGTLTRGIVSSVRPVQEQNGVRIDAAIQTDAAINPGNSGGPLMNYRGDVVGINTLIYSEVGQSAGIGFAIPINTAKAVLNDLLTLGRVKRPSIGIQSIGISPDFAQQYGLAAESGVLILRVVPGGAADRAGLKGGSRRIVYGNVPLEIGGDLIVEMDGQPVESPQDLARVLDNHRSGDTIEVVVFRGDRKLKVRVVLGESGAQQT